MESQFSLRGGRIDSLGQAHEVCAFLFERLHLGHQVLERAAEPVEAPDAKRVSFSKLLQAALQFGLFLRRAGGLLPVDTLTTSGFKLADLGVEVLVPCRHSSVADTHGEIIAL
mgnify:FL=1